MSELLTDEQLPEELVEELDETSAEFVDQLVTKLVLFTEQFCDVEFFPYQIPIAYRVIESIVIGDGEEITLVATRQSGKSEVISNVLASMMVILPKLAPIYLSLIKVSGVVYLPQLKIKQTRCLVAL